MRETPMPDLRTVLDERARRLDPHPMPDAFDRTLRRARRRARNRRLGAALVAFAVFAGTGTGLWLALQSRPPTHRVPTELPTPGAVSTIPLPAAPSDVAVVPDGTVWVALGDALARIDPITGEVTTEYEEAFQARTGQLTGIAVRAEGVFTDAWMSDSGGLVWHVLIPPPGFEGIARGPTPVDVGGPALGVAVGAGAVWAAVAHESSGEVVRIDERTEEVTDRYFGGVSGSFEGAGSLAVADGSVWVQGAAERNPRSSILGPAESSLRRSPESWRHPDARTGTGSKGGPAPVRRYDGSGSCGASGPSTRHGGGSGSTLGSHTRNDEPPPSRSSTQARPPCSSAKRATSESPTPTPGECDRVCGPWRKGSKIADCSSGGTPGPSSSTAMRTPSSSWRTRTQMRVPSGVWRIALATRFSTIRSTFGPSSHAVT